MPIKHLKERKLQLRAKHKKIRSNFSKEKKDKLDRAITERFLSNPAYLENDTIFVFVSKDIEVDTYGIINQAFKDNKKVCAPKCNVKEKLMDYYYINSLDDLEKGYYDLLEPNTEKCQKVTDLSKGLCLVPGLVYDREGYRLGFGMGYYDRFLIDFSGTTIGVCYSVCVEKEIPRGFYDRSIDLLVTDKYTIDTTG